MIKLVMCLHRRADLSRAEFMDYWQNEHAPFFKANAATIGAKKYVQSQTIDTEVNAGMQFVRGMQPEYDGVVEVWYDNEEDLVAAFKTPEGEKLAAALLEDEKNFIDASRSTAFLVREVEIDLE